MLCKNKFPCSVSLNLSHTWTQGKEAISPDDLPMKIVEKAFDLIDFRADDRFYFSAFLLSYNRVKVPKIVLFQH